MEVVIAILVLIGMLSASGLLPENSPSAGVEKTETVVPAIQEPEVRPDCDQHEPVFRDLTIPYEQSTSEEAGEAGDRCDE